MNKEKKETTNKLIGLLIVMANIILISTLAGIGCSLTYFYMGYRLLFSIFGGCFFSGLFSCYLTLLYLMRMKIIREVKE